MVQRCPAVPAAAKVIARTARSRSALGATTMALLPPSSRSVRAEPLRGARRHRAAHPRAAGGADERHARIADQGVAGLAAAEDHLRQTLRGIAEAPPSARSRIAWQASAVSGVFSEGFHTTRVAAGQRERGVPRPHRDGKVERRDDAHHAKRMPGLHHPVPRPLGSDREAVELAREAHGEVADVDHLLHFAVAFLQDLAGLDRNQPAERGLLRAQFLPEEAQQLAAARRRHAAPRPERRGGGADLCLHVGRRIGAQHRELGAVDRRAASEVLSGVRREIDPQFLQEQFRIHGGSSSSGLCHATSEPCRIIWR